MGLIDREQLLSPISGAEPAGGNLEYDPAFAALERTAQGKPEQRMGESIVPAEPPDWNSALEQCLALLQKTRDLRVAVHLTNALLQRSGYVGFAEGLALLEGMLSTFWETVHPELDHEEDDDPTMRITALSALSAPAVLQTLRSTPLIQAKALGAVSFRDIQALAGEAPAPGSAPTADAATVEGAFQEVELEALEAVAAAVTQCSESLRAMDGIFETRTGSRGPEFAPLVQTLRELEKALGPGVATRRAALQGSDPDSEQEAGEGEPGAARGAALSGEIRSREDVVRAIDKICAYYARCEPTSPLPLLLERCKRHVTSSFIDIIRDLAPDSVAKVEGLAGSKPK
jgi:type VI secretion system protein ImpA